MSSNKTKKIVLSSFASLLVIAFAIYFYVEFKNNIDSILESKLETNYLLISLSLIPTIAAYLLITHCWRYT